MVLSTDQRQDMKVVGDVMDKKVKQLKEIVTHKTLLKLKDFQ